MLFGRKSFDMDDYLRSLISAVYSLATLGSTIFVGRGTHLILPRDRVLAVRFICSDEFRVKRLASLLHINTAEATRTLVKLDKEQASFFRKAYGRKDASAAEFDLVINCDHFGLPKLAADLVARAFRNKFGDELKG
jgi:cytidylate kinase